LRGFTSFKEKEGPPLTTNAIGLRHPSRNSVKKKGGKKAQVNKKHRGSLRANLLKPTTAHRHDDKLRRASRKKERVTQRKAHILNGQCSPHRGCWLESDPYARKYDATQLLTIFQVVRKGGKRKMRRKKD